MTLINTKEMKETAWSGNSIDNQIKNNINSIKSNCQNLKTAIEELSKCNGKRSTESPVGKNYHTLSATDAINYSAVYNPIYKTWVINSAIQHYNTNAISGIIKEIENLEELLGKNSEQFVKLESTADNLDVIVGEMNTEGENAAKDPSIATITGSLITQSSATRKGAESGDRAVNGTDLSGIKEENFYLYENQPIRFRKGEGVEEGSYGIEKWDGNTWVTMKWIPKETMQEIADQYVNYKKFENQVNNGINNIKNQAAAALTAAASSFLNGFNKQKENPDLKDRGYPSSTENNSTVPLGVQKREREPEKILTSTDLKYIDHSKKIIKEKNIEQQAIDKGLGKLAPQEEWKLKTNKSDGKQYTEIPTEHGGRLVIFNDEIRTASKVGKNVKAYNFFDVNNNLISAHSILTELPSAKIQL